MLELPPVASVIGWRLTTRLPRDHYVQVDSNDYRHSRSRSATRSRSSLISAGGRDLAGQRGGSA